MKFLLSSLIALALPSIASAEFSIASCEGKSFTVKPSEISVEEAKILFEVAADPAETGQTMMRFESGRRGFQYWNWTSALIEELERHCVTQYHLARQPKDGTWLFTHDAATFEGCPEGVAVPVGMTGTRDLKWPNFFTPKPFFKDSQIEFDLERLSHEHWTAVAKPIANMPGVFDVHYDFKVASPQQIDITGTVSIKIDGGAIKADCSGSVEMTATLQ